MQTLLWLVSMKQNAKGNKFETFNKRLDVLCFCYLRVNSFNRLPCFCTHVASLRDHIATGH